VLVYHFIIATAILELPFVAANSLLAVIAAALVFVRLRVIADFTAI
jgi:hypothetical protein